MSGAYNISGGVRLRGALNESAVEGAFNALVKRHESLRTIFVQTADGQGAQRALAAMAVRIERTELRELPVSAREAALSQVAQAEATGPFDLVSGPLLRVRLLRLEDREHVLLLTMHHIISDGWSLRVLVEEFGRLYSWGLQARDPNIGWDREADLEPLPIQYIDYAQWQRGLADRRRG